MNQSPDCTVIPRVFPCQKYNIVRLRNNGSSFVYCIIPSVFVPYITLHIKQYFMNIKDERVKRLKSQCMTCKQNVSLPKNIVSIKPKVQQCTSSICLNYDSFIKNIRKRIVYLFRDV